MTWKQWIRNTQGRWVLVFCATASTLMILYMPSYYEQIIGPKAGILLNDPLLNYFTPVDWSTPVFVILTLVIIQTMIAYAGSPAVFLTALMTYCIVSIFRMVTMYVITLEPPSDMILLIDPISAVLAYPYNGFAKDLFFSGHVSTVMIMVFVERSRAWYLVKLAGASLMALFLAWQHVHYTVDLIAAPIITYVIFWGVRKLIRGIDQQDKSS